MSVAFQSRVGRVVSEGQIDFITRDVPAPKADEVVIRICASALCGSDLHIFKAKHPSVPLPATIGHEFSGDIAAIGSDVSGLALGDRVTAEPCTTCGSCHACRHGEYGSCDEISFIYRKGDGAMADYITVKASSVFLLPDTMSYEAGALMEPLAVATHAARRGEITLGETVLVLGGGAIGLLIAALAKHMGAAEIILSDPSPFRRDMAKKLGATRVVSPLEAEALTLAVQEATQGRGADKVFECVGREETFVQSMQLLRKKGLATIVGIFEQPHITIPVMGLVQREIRIQGAQGYCWDFPIALQMAEVINLEQLVTHTLPLDDLQKALELNLDRTQNTIKVVLKP